MKNTESKEKWKIQSSISLHLNSIDDAAIFLNSFTPELKTMPTRRSKLVISQEKSKILFQINAKDVTAFRATINSVLQFSNVVTKTIDYIDKSKDRN
ncbi:MAG: hypothetical protein GF364_22060 [Candidatus Lokiarchaeota archaeon]|nr:hypothetical protein [Candidatus Lokiarchaeota archaeon]